MHNPEYHPEQNPYQDPRFQPPGAMQGQPPPYPDPNYPHPGGAPPPPYQDPRFLPPGAMQGQPPPYPDPNFQQPGGMPPNNMPPYPPGKPPSFFEQNKKKLIFGGIVAGLLLLIIYMMSSCGGDDPADVDNNATPTPIPVTQQPADTESGAADIDQQVTELAQQMAREQMELWLANNPTATPLYSRDSMEPYAPQHFLEDYINCIHPDIAPGTSERRSLETTLLLDLARAAQEFIDQRCRKDDRVSTFILDLLHPPAAPTEVPEDGADNAPPEDAMSTPEATPAP